MSSLLVNGDIWKVTVVSFLTLEEQLGLMGLHWSISGVVGIPDGQDLAEAIDAAISTPLRNWLTLQSSYAGCEAVRVFPAPVSVADISIIHAGVGLNGTGAIPSQCCAVLHLQTGTIGKSHQGRTYVPFPPLGALDDGGVINAPARALLTLIADAIGAGVVVGAGGNTALATLGVYSKKLGVITDVTDIGIPFGFGTQRRRGFYGRTNLRPF
jgi:hypothetical protein